MIKRKIKAVLFSVFTLGIILSGRIYAADASNFFSVSPMNQMISLTPGETYYGNFHVVNPGTSNTAFEYSLTVKPFITDNDGQVDEGENGNYTLMAKWIELASSEGVIMPNDSAEIRFAIHVPEDAPAGGQYAMIAVKSAPSKVDNPNVDLREVFETGHLIYADVAGETVRKGSMTNVNVPGFLFSGKIIGSAAITNEGNVHSQATHTMQIFPLFSSEEAFTNEEDPKKAWIMPGNTTISSVSWDGTPSVGIFHVIYNVEYEGVESKVDKYVIVCPIWLLFIITSIIILIIIKIFSKNSRGNK